MVLPSQGAEPGVGEEAFWSWPLGHRGGADGAIQGVFEEERPLRADHPGPERLRGQQAEEVGSTEAAGRQRTGRSSQRQRQKSNGCRPGPAQE